MLKKKKIYRCSHCGNLVEGLWNGEPSIVCCGDAMEELVANTQDAAVEKHVPLVTRDGDAVNVAVGSTAHPMTPEHYILFVEVVAGDDIFRHDFKEGDDTATASFYVPAGKDIEVRAYCNLHGLWKA